MCRLLGIVSKKPIDPQILLEFRRLAEKGKTPKDFGCEQLSTRAGHPDGWGIACLAGDGEVYHRSHVKATEDPLFEQAVRDVGRLVLPPFLLVAHLRRAARTETVMEEFNQPFRREIGRQILFFGHNGNIEGFGVREGRIDSQYFLERLLPALDVTSFSAAEFDRRLGDLKNSIGSEFPKKVTSLTFVLLRGDELVAHRDARECKPYYSLHKASNERLFVVCSEVLSAIPGSWRLLKNNETVAVSVNDL